MVPSLLLRLHQQVGLRLSRSGAHVLTFSLAAGKRPVKPSKPQALMGKKPAKFALEGNKWLIVRAESRRMTLTVRLHPHTGVPREPVSTDGRQRRAQSDSEPFRLQELDDRHQGQGQRDHHRFVEYP